jgi:hypothetical protein
MHHNELISEYFVSSYIWPVQVLIAIVDILFANSCSPTIDKLLAPNTCDFQTLRSKSIIFYYQLKFFWYLENTILHHTCLDQGFFPLFLYRKFHKFLQNFRWEKQKFPKFPNLFVKKVTNFLFKKNPLIYVCRLGNIWFKWDQNMSNTLQIKTFDWIKLLLITILPESGFQLFRPMVWELLNIEKSYQIKFNKIQRKKK